MSAARFLPNRVGKALYAARYFSRLAGNPP